MKGKLSEAVKTLRSALGVTQLELAVKLDIGGHSIAHFESGRKPDAVITARLCGVAHEAGLDDLADVFAVALPGVEEGLLIPVWRLPKEQQPESAPTFVEVRPAPPVVSRFENKPGTVLVEDQRPERKTMRASVEAESNVAHRNSSAPKVHRRAFRLPSS
jgi:transcriptional regulator with XRE-family HTH domain